MFIIKSYNLIVAVLFFGTLIYGLFFWKGRRKEWWGAVFLVFGAILLLGYTLNLIGFIYEHYSLPNWLLIILLLGILIYAPIGLEKAYKKFIRLKKDTR
jgi:uncharacterized membrane protein